MSHIFPPKELTSLETLIIAGESASKKMLETWYRDSTIINAYGPTEGTVCTSSFAYHKLEQIPTIIGRPISNIEVYILDAYQNPVPIGVSGEIYIGGTGLARGYLQQT